MARQETRPRGMWATDLDQFESDDFSDLEELGDEAWLDVQQFDPPTEGTRRARDRRTATRSTRVKTRPAPPADELEADLAFDEDESPRQRERKRVEVSEGFKCRHCKNFIGIPPSGGRNRNHCPLCLHSLHVDGKTPGDRESDCRSLMRPIGIFYRPKGEQMVVHRCSGCGFVRYNRIAADDNPIILSELVVLDPPGPGADWLLEVQQPAR